MINHFLFRRQVLNWEYLLSIPSLLVRLLDTVAISLSDFLAFIAAFQLIFCEIKLSHALCSR